MGRSGTMGRPCSNNALGGAPAPPSQPQHSGATGASVAVTATAGGHGLRLADLTLAPHGGRTRHGAAGRSGRAGRLTRGPGAATRNSAPGTLRS